ncbi:hypothetical protein AGOR_G00047520 [Albula goreensis]|uniref:PLAC domain-containing protein n=1 Tax=Albula goreensis TaxID=1534307 RepID=A0A8T3DW64_9TELE|nr:hypothetical protein AGOR_G00047520 [Albula goreensis]
MGDIEDEVPEVGGVTIRVSLHETSPSPSPNTKVASRPTLTTTAPHASTTRWVRTTSQFHLTAPSATPFIKPDAKWRLVSTSVPRTTQRSHPGLVKKGNTTETLLPIMRNLNPGLKRTTTPPRKSSTTPQPKRRSPLDSKPTVQAEVSWVVGNWSECSTSCGLGAVWRTVVCSTSQESDCANIKRPEPARRCHLRPCATWHSGNWSKCPEGCLGGTKQRDVQCVDSQNKRQLRPFHCQALAYKPPSSLPCAPQPCLDWHTSPWGQCSKSCGEGARERLVYCSEHNRCNPAQRPNNTELCNKHQCSHWVTEDWEECTMTCGGGVQHRVVKCVSDDKESGTGDSSGPCEKSTRPDSFRKCNLQECKRKQVPWCSKNSMSSRFCEKLKLLGRCSLSSIRKQCCVTCLG